MYKIVGKYKEKDYEELDTCLLLESAIEMVYKYRQSFGKDWDIIYYNTDTDE